MALCFPKVGMQEYQSFLAKPHCCATLSRAHDRFIRLKKGMGEEGEEMGEILRSFQNKQTSSQSLSLRGRGQRHCFALLAGGLGHFPTVLGSLGWVMLPKWDIQVALGYPWHILALSLNFCSHPSNPPVPKAWDFTLVSFIHLFVHIIHSYIQYLIPNFGCVSGTGDRAANN